MVCFSPVQRLKKRAVSIGAVSLITMMTATNVPVASTQEIDASQLTQLATQLSSAVSDISALEAQMGGLQEAVNQALVDLKDAQIIAEAARQNAAEASDELDKATSDVSTAQGRLDELARTAYRHGGAGSNPSMLSSGSDAKRELDRFTFLRRQAAEQRGVVDALDAERTKKANKESALRAAQKEAEDREAAAQAAEQSAKDAIAQHTLELSAKQNEREQLLDQARQVKEQIDKLKSAGNEGASSNESEGQSLPGAQGVTNPGADTAAPAAIREADEAAAAQASAPETSNEDPPAAPSEGNANAGSGNEVATQESRGTDAELVGGTADGEQGSSASSSSLPEVADRSAGGSPAPREIDYLQLANTAVNTAQAVVDSGLLDPGTLDDPFKTVDALGTVLPALSGSSSLSSTTADVASGNGGRSGDATTESDLLDALNNLGNSGATDSGNATSDYLDLGTMEDLSNKASAAISGSRNQRIETVIARAKSQLGTPYAWGGGNASGPTKGIRDGGVADAYGDYNKVGFDCSGLVLYAFAGAGIALPHYTGYQYQRGTKVDISDIQRGDLLFWGPSGNQHVAIYLGDGQMIEAPQSGGAVQISPVRYGGMAPNAVRLI